MQSGIKENLSRAIGTNRLDMQIHRMNKIIYYRIREEGNQFSAYR